MKRVILGTIAGLLLTTFLLAFSGIMYLEINYSRIGDVDNEINNNQVSSVEINGTYTMSTYNIGFGAYDREFSFFMDKGETLTGEKLQGKYGKAVSKENALKNTNGSIDILNYLDSDFMLLQEVDTNSHRSYKINQSNMISDNFNNHGSVFASNFHSGFLPYPIHDFHGIVNSGILSLSKYHMNSSNRLELPVTTEFFPKFFDLDRCISVMRIAVENTDKELVIINCHLSAYDEGGVFRKQQVELLNNLLEKEYKAGNYVIAGGDFNHNIGGIEFETTKKTPVWIQPLTNDDLVDNYTIIAGDTSPTCRDSDSPYAVNETFVSIVDGFIVSNNIRVEFVKNIVTMNEQDITFLYSDHNPVKMEFTLLEM